MAPLYFKTRISRRRDVMQVSEAVWCFIFILARLGRSMISEGGASKCGYMATGSREWLLIQHTPECLGGDKERSRFLQIFGTSSMKLTLTPRRWSLLEKLVKEFHARHGTRMFITVFTRNRHWNLSWGSWTQSAPSHCSFKIRFNIIRSYMPMPPS